MNKVFFNETYINPLTDFGFKRIFGQEKNKELLIDFLNEIIEEERCIVDIEYQPTLQVGVTEHDRKAVFDIFCKNEKGEFFIVEMQKARQPYFVDRSLFYSTFPIQNQAPQGNWNFELKAVYTVALLDFVLFDDVEDEQFGIERIYLTRERTQKRYSKKLNLIFVELPKFTKKLEELEMNADRWLFCLKNLSRLNTRPAAVQGKIFERLFKAAEINKLTEKEMETYNKSILEYEDVRSAVDFAKEEYFAKGISQGVAQGIMEEKNEIARNMLNAKIPVSMIAQVTRLTPEEIINL